jgi:hypothetical protein
MIRLGLIDVLVLVAPTAPAGPVQPSPAPPPEWNVGLSGVPEGDQFLSCRRVGLRDLECDPLRDVL